MRLLYPFAKRFIAGHDFDSAKPAIEKLMNEGYEVSIDYIGENSRNHTQARKAYKQYLEIINYFKDKKIDISVKPSHLGLHVHAYLAYIFINGLAKRAKEYGHTIRLDMEDSSVTEVTRNLAISLNGKHGNVGVAVQANLFRTKRDLTFLINKGVSVRLVKGAYRENKDVAYQSDLQIENAFFSYAARLKKKLANRPAIATHDQALLKDVAEMLSNPKYFDYEFLYGVRRDLQKNFKSEGFTVRIYVPFGTDWLPYTMRRLREWKNLKFVILNIFRELLK
jgi:proline dehydrogenase